MSHRGVGVVALGTALIAVVITCATGTGADRTSSDSAARTAETHAPPPAHGGGPDDAASAPSGSARTYVADGDAGPPEVSRPDDGTPDRDTSPDCPDASGMTGLLACDRIAVGSTTSPDFDGDGDDETVRFAHADGRYYLEVRSTDGRRARLGVPDGPPLTERFYTAERDDGGDSAQPFRRDFGWVVDWEVVRAEAGVLSQSPGWTISDALGDGLRLSSLDVQILLYRTDDGWVVMHLGY